MLIAVLLPISTLANTPLDSINLAGEYELEEVLDSGDDYTTKRLRCHPTITIRVNEDEVDVLKPYDNSKYRSIESRFESKYAGCRSSYGDLGLRKDCLKFKKNSVTETVSEKTLIGYIRNTEKIKLINNKTQLIHFTRDWFIPLGALFEDNNVKCLYNRL